MKPIQRLVRSPWVAAIFFSLAIGLLTLLLRGGGHLEGLELKAYDWFTLMKPQGSNPEKRIAILGIFEEDIREIGQWPISDAVLAESLAILSGYDPVIIGLDLFRDIPVPPGREALNALLSKNRDIIGVMKFGRNGVPPPPVLAGTDQIAFNDILVDRDGIVRRALLFMDDGQKVFPSLAVMLSIHYLHSKEGITPEPDEENPENIRLGNTTIHPFEKNDGSYVEADARGYQFLINNWRTGFPIFSLSQLLSGGMDQDSLKDKIVLIGVMAESVKDLFFTPQTGGFHKNGPIPGVMLHAMIVDQLLGFALDGGAPMDSLDDWQEKLMIVFLGLLGGITGLRTRSTPSFFLGLAGGLLLLFGVCYAAFLRNCWIPMLPSAMTWTLSLAGLTAYMVSREKRQRTVLMELFTKHVSSDVAEDIWRKRDQFLENGRPRSQELTVTVLFSDLKGYTTISEKLSPPALVRWLNVYLDAMTTVIMEHKGVVDDFVGDGIKANFGVPLARVTEEAIHEDAVLAAKCALEMEKELHRLNSVWRDKGMPEVGMRIGICTGPVVAGSVGSSQRMKYTTVGDTVNTAARLEQFDKSLARESPCRILISESTARSLGDGFYTEEVGELHLKGKDKKIVAYRLFGREQPHLEKKEVLP